MKKLLLLLVLVSLQVFAGVPLSTNFTLNTALPLDDRAQVTNLTARNALPALRRWEGMLVYVKSEKKHFTLVDGIADINWTELSGSGGGGISEWEPSTDYKSKDLVLQNGEIFQAINDFTSGVSFDPADFTPISKYVTADVVPDPGKITFWKTNDPYGLLDSGAANLDTSGNLSGLNNVTILGDTTLKTSLTGVVKAVSGLLSASAVDLSLDVVGTLPITNGGTGSTSQSWVDLTTNQSGIAGNKAFTGNISTSGTMLASNLSGTNTGDLTTSGASGSTTTTNKLKAPFRQMTPSATGEVDIETGNSNELINPRFQATTYNDGWTCSLGTMSQGVGPDGSKALSVVSTGGGFRCRQTFTSSADLKGTLARFYARVKTAAPDVKICGLDGGILTANEVGCVTVNPTNAGEVFDDPSGFFRYGDTLYGIVIYTNNAAVFPTVIDDVSMGAAGLTTTTIQGDTVYSAFINAAGDTSGENTDWIGGNCTIASTSQFTCNFKTGVFSVAPNCTVNVVRNINGVQDLASFRIVTSTSFTVNTYSNSGTNSPFAFQVICQKQGADYAKSSSSGILSSNADTNWTNFTPTGGWTTNTTYTGKYKYVGDSAVIQLKVVTSGAPGGNTALSFNMPAVIGVIDTSKLVGGTLITNSGNTLDAGSAIYDARAVATSSTIVSFNSNASGITKTYPMTWASGDNMEITFTVPIVGRTVSPLAIIPLAGTATTPGYSGQVESFEFGYGATASTACTTGTCAYLRQEGDAVLSFVNTGTGAYTLNTKRTYKTIFCTGGGSGANYAVAFMGTGAGPGSSFTIQTGHAATNINTWGTVFCKGYY